MGPCNTDGDEAVIEIAMRCRATDDATVVRGTVHSAGSDLQFSGWLELMEVLEGIAVDSGSSRLS